VSCALVENKGNKHRYNNTALNKPFMLRTLRKNNDNSLWNFSGSLLFINNVQKNLVNDGDN